MTESNRHERHKGMTLVKQATTWVAVGGVAATGLFAGAAVASNAGHTSVPRTATSSGTAATSGTSGTSGTSPTAVSPESSDNSQPSDDSHQFQAPATAPTNVGGGGAVVSGGS
jgi:hypothetical protein